MGCRRIECGSALKEKHEGIRVLSGRCRAHSGRGAVVLLVGVVRVIVAAVIAVTTRGASGAAAAVLSTAHSPVYQALGLLGTTFFSSALVVTSPRERLAPTE